MNTKSFVAIVVTVVCGMTLSAGLSLRHQVRNPVFCDVCQLRLNPRTGTQEQHDPSEEPGINGVVGQSLGDPQDLEIVRILFVNVSNG